MNKCPGVLLHCSHLIGSQYCVYIDRLSSSVRGDFIAPPQVSELYIDLLCRYNFTGVVEFLKTNENYRVDETLKVIQKVSVFFKRIW